jgi:putative membrane protein
MRTILLFLATAGLVFGRRQTPDRDFMNAASQANVAEIGAAKLAVAKSKEDFVKSFAQKMIEDHSKAQQELADLAQQQNVILTVRPDTEHQHMLQELEGLSGAAFDSAYMQSQLLDHQVAITLFRQQSQEGKDKAAKAYAEKYLPQLQHHLDMIKKRNSGMHAMQK